MFERSIVAKTGQLWKFYLAYALMIPVAVLIFGESFVPERLRMWVYLGMPLLTLAGFFVLFVTIRCPQCGARWFWLAASRHDQRQFGKVLHREYCTECAAQQGAPADAPALRAVVPSGPSGPRRS